MSLIRWQPFREIEALQREMNQLFESLTPLAPMVRDGDFPFVPAAELQETPEAIMLKLELPGIDPEALDIQVTEDYVSITGERKSESRSEENGVTRTEFRYGRFQRSIPLAAQVQRDKGEATYKDGVLRLTLPKAEGEKPLPIKVKVG